MRIETKTKLDVFDVDVAVVLTLENKIRNRALISISFENKLQPTLTRIIFTENFENQNF